MKQRLKLLTIGVLCLFIAACGQQQSDKNGSDKKQKNKQEQNGGKGARLAHDKLDVETLGLERSDGKKWQADSITNLQMLKLDNRIDDYGKKIRRLGSSDYQKLEADINHAVKQINAKSQISGEARKQLNIILKHMKKEAKVLGLEKKKKAQVALFNLSELVKAYEEHFK